MLKLTIKPGEYINIGDDVRVIYSGGSEGNIHLLIDAPRELNIVRSKVLARNTANSDKKESRYISPYYAERGLSPETLSKIRTPLRRMLPRWRGTWSTQRCWRKNITSRIRDMWPLPG